MFDVKPGVYSLDADVMDNAICTQQVGEYWKLNDYYSEKLGVDAFSISRFGKGHVEITEDAKLGFSVPMGDGTAHPSIARVK